MLEKLKSFVESTKGIILSIVMPIIGVLAFIWFLLTRNRELKNEIDILRATHELEQADKLIEKNKEKSDNAEEEYKHIRDTYKSEPRSDK